MREQGELCEFIKFLTQLLFPEETVLFASLSADDHSGAHDGPPWSFLSVARQSVLISAEL